MVRLRIILGLNSSIQLTKRLVLDLLQINTLIRKRNRDNNTSKIEQVDHRRIAVIPELIMADGSRRGNGGDDRIDVLAQFVFELAPLVEVFALVTPFLQVDFPELVHVDLACVWVKEVFDVRD